MLCGIRHDSSHHSHHRRFLRSFRSHRSLEAYGNSSDTHTTTMSHRPRLPSDASSLASSRPSLSTRSEMSVVDWDPLRLHPPLAPGPSPPLRDAADARCSRPYQPHELRHARSSHTLRRPATPPQQHPAASFSSETVIYDGFDFGFSSKPTPTTSSTVVPRRRAPSPTPSEDSLSSSGFDDLGLGLGLDSAAGSTARLSARPRPRPRPHPESPSLLNDEAEYFIRRGGWKRRGIVFVDGSPLAGEDETFEI